MNLYLLKQNDESGYDTFDSCVVAAKCEYDAVRTHPGDYYEWDNNKSGWMFCYTDGRKELCDRYHAWTNNIMLVNVTLLGEAKEGIEAGVVCASFNAG